MQATHPLRITINNHPVDTIAPVVERGLKTIFDGAVDTGVVIVKETVKVIATAQCGPLAGESAQGTVAASSIVAAPKIKEAGHKSIESSVRYAARGTKASLHCSVNWNNRK